MNKLVCIKYKNYFWTGARWSSIYQFCKKYNCASAVRIVKRRFHSLEPQPQIFLCKIIEDRIARRQLRKSQAKKGYRNDRSIVDGR